MKNNLDKYIMPTYGKRKLEFVRGRGIYLYSKDKKKYLDFGSGIAVNSLGHCHPKIVKALKDQSSKLWHTSNLYKNKKQEEYAKILCSKTFADQVFFTNSGAESIECGLKVIKTYHNYHGNYKRKNIITFEGAFHGRTLATLSASKNNKNSHIFKPLMPGFIQIPFNNFEILKNNINDRTAAILIETIQGEGGIKPVPINFLKKIRNLCNQKKILLFLDEVQCGFGRSGKLFSHEWAGIKPDLMAVAKGIGSGFPMGACLATKKTTIGMKKGIHGSTFGGNQLAVSVGLEVIKEITSKGFLKNVDNISRYFWEKLKELEIKFDEISEVRGAGLMIGIKTKTLNTKINDLFIKNGLLAVTAGDNVIRLTPPLIVTKAEIDTALNIINKVLKKI